VTHPSQSRTAAQAPTPAGPRGRGRTPHCGSRRWRPTTPSFPGCKDEQAERRGRGLGADPKPVRPRHSPVRTQPCLSCPFPTPIPAGPPQPGLLLTRSAPGPDLHDPSRSPAVPSRDPALSCPPQLPPQPQSSPTPARPRPCPGPLRAWPGLALTAAGRVPPGRWRPCDRRARAQVRAGAREGRRPAGGRGRPAHLSAPPAPPDRPPAGSSPQPQYPATAQHAGTAEEGDGRKRRRGRAGPEAKEKGRRGLAAAATDSSLFGPENVSTSRLRIPNAPSRSHENTQLPLPGPRGSSAPRVPALSPGALTRRAGRLALGARESLTSWRRGVVIGCARHPGVTSTSPGLSARALLAASVFGAHAHAVRPAPLRTLLPAPPRPTHAAHSTYASRTPRPSSPCPGCTPLPVGFLLRLGL
jgi:hypothetical protein